LDRLDPFRWRLTEVPFGLGNPYWLDDPNPDLDYHVRELTLPDPGDEERLTEQVGRLIAQPLDRSRPLWELYLIHGLSGGRVAVLTKVHHAAVDGLSGAEILGALVDLEPVGPQAATVSDNLAPAARRRAPGRVQMLARGLSALPGQRIRALRKLPQALPSVDQVPTIRNLPGVTALASAGRRVDRAVPRRKTAESESEGVEFPRLHAPRTSFNQPITADRRVALSRQSLYDVKRIKNHFGLTVNDVVMAICAGALRSWLDARGELPEQPLLTIVPVSTRTEEQRGTFGNHVTTMLAPIPTDIRDPEDRLHAAREAMRAAKARHGATPPTVLEDINAVIPPALFGAFVRRSSRLAASVPHEAAVNLIVSNVPGPPIPVYLAGAQLEALYPISALAHGIGLNITVMSYCGKLDFGIVADRDLVDDVWSLAAALREAQAELMALLPESGSDAASPSRVASVSHC
jgi:diacylglycerol O-acyltransferase